MITPFNKTPNLSFFLPVLIYSCPPESISGLNLIATSTILFSLVANFSILNISASDSILKDKIFFLMPWIISSLDFAMPVNIIFFGSTPAAKTLSNSPPETISKPLPLFFNNLSTEILLRDLTEKQTNPSFFSKALE